MVKKYRKKPVVIQAIEWDGSYSSSQSIKKMFPKIRTLSQSYHKEHDTCTLWKIGTLEGGHRVSKGDFIIKGVKGEFYPCKPDIFKATYEEVK